MSISDELERLQNAETKEERDEAIERVRRAVRVAESTDRAIANIQESMVAMACAFESMSLAAREVATVMESVDWSQVEMGPPLDHPHHSAERVAELEAMEAREQGGGIDDAVCYRCGDCGKVSDGPWCPCRDDEDD